MSEDNIECICGDSICEGPQETESKTCSIPGYHSPHPSAPNCPGRPAPEESMDNYIDIGPECFTNGNVISFKGENYYRACNEFVSDLPDGGQSFCVKRVGHAGNMHEDYDNRATWKEED